MPLNNLHNSKFSLKSFRRTKIIATVGPSTDSYELIHNLISSGANGIRLNFSHGTNDERKKQIEWIRKASHDLGRPIAIIADLQGPKIRLGDFEGTIEISKGQAFRLGFNAEYAQSGIIPTQYDLSKKVKRGEQVFLFDGKLHAQITSVKDGIIYLEAENSAILIKRKGINLPDTDFGGDVITPKDRKDLLFLSTHDIDYVAQSFVQSADDVVELRKIIRGLNMQAKIIAKFETKSALNNMEDIIKETDALMVARGDLAYEVLPEAVPILQRQLLGLCMEHTKPVIIATQMLFSMTTSTEPTRAEVSDVASAVITGADCLMLSDETAIGAHPIEAIKFMRRIIIYTENNMPLKVTYPSYYEESIQSAISKSIVSLSQAVSAKAIVAETKSGATARMISARRVRIPIIAVTNDIRVSQQLAIIFNIKSYVRPVDKFAATKLTAWLQANKILHKGDLIVTASGQHPGVVGTTDTVKVRMIE